MDQAFLSNFAVRLSRREASAVSALKALAQRHMRGDAKATRALKLIEIHMRSNGLSVGAAAPISLFGKIIHLAMKPLSFTLHTTGKVLGLAARGVARTGQLAGHLASKAGDLASAPLAAVGSKLAGAPRALPAHKHIP